MAKENTLKSQVLAYFTEMGTRTAKEAERAIREKTGDKFTHKAITSRVSELKREGKLVKTGDKFGGFTEYRVVA